MKNNFLINVDKSKLKHTKKQYTISNISTYKSSRKAFWNRFFSKKINYFWSALFILFFIYIICCVLFYRYSATEPIFDSEIVINLPNYHNASIKTKFKPDDPLMQVLINNNEKFPDLKIIQSQNQIRDTFVIQYNPYKLIEALTNKKYVLIFGTNNNKIDRFSFFNNSLGYSILITFVVISIQVCFGTLLGSYIGYYSNKTQGKISYYLLNILNVIPFLIISIILFHLIGYSVLNAVIILGFFGTINFFYSSFANTLNVKNKEYIYAYKVSGFTNNQIIFKIIFIENFYLNLSLIADNLGLNLLILASLAFFNVKNINESLNIGNVFKDLINDFSNIPYLLYVTFMVSFYVLICHLISVALYKAWLVK